MVQSIGGNCLTVVFNVLEIVGKEAFSLFECILAPIFGTPAKPGKPLQERKVVIVPKITPEEIINKAKGYEKALCRELSKLQNFYDQNFPKKPLWQKKPTAPLQTSLSQEVLGRYSQYGEEVKAFIAQATHDLEDVNAKEAGVVVSRLENSHTAYVKLLNRYVEKLKVTS